MKKLTACLLTAVFVLSICTQSVFAAITTNAQPWAVPYMEKAYGYGIVSEELLQKATSNITRKEFCHVVMSFYRQTVDPNIEFTMENPFSDTDDQDILLSYQLGIIAGMDEGIFNPDHYLTREQLCIILSKLLDVCGIQTDTKDGELSFADTVSLQQSTKDYIKKICDAGYMSGYTDGNFYPKNSLKVQEAVLVVLNIYETSQKTDAKEEQEAVLEKEMPQKGAVSLNGKKIALDAEMETVKAVWGEPIRIDETVYGLDRYVYAPSEDMYLLVTIKEGKVVSFYALGENLTYENITITQKPSDLNLPVRISAVSNNAVYSNEYASVSFPLDYMGNICGISVTDLSFAQGDYLMSGTYLTLREDMETELFEMVNVLRTLDGISALKWDEYLQDSASEHSTDMVKNRYFSYNSLDGSTPFARMKAKENTFHTATEVIANCRGDVTELFSELIRSTGKYNSIMDETMSNAGVGIASDSKTLYLTMDMCGFGD